MQELADLVEAKRLFFHYYNPQSPAPTEAQASVLAQATRHDVEFDSLPMPVYSWGQGPTVLFVHGGRGHAGFAHGLVQPIVDAGFRLVAIDVLAHGGSRHHGVSVDLIGAAMAMIAREVGPIDTLVMHSMGSIWGLCALRHGLEPQRAICIAPIANARSVFKLFVASHGASKTVASSLERLLEGFDGPRMWERMSPVRLVAGLEMPCVIFHGAEDRFIPPDAGRQVAEAWQGAAFELVPDANHNSILEHPQLLQGVSRFLSQR